MDKGKAGLTDGSSVTLLWGQDLLGLSEEAGRAVGRSEGLLGTVQHQQILATPLYFAGSGRRKGNTDSLSDKETGLSSALRFQIHHKKAPARPPRPRRSLRAAYGAKFSARGEIGPTSGAGEALHKGLPRQPPTPRLTAPFKARSDSASVLLLAAAGREPDARSLAALRRGLCPQENSVSQPAR